MKHHCCAEPVAVHMHRKACYWGRSEQEPKPGSRDIAEVKQEEHNETLPGIEQRGAFKLKSGVG